MKFKGATPATSDTGAEITAQMLTNDQVNLIVEDTSVLNTGIVRGNVVKFSVSLSKWVLCDGTVSPDKTDIIGIVEDADGTSGQVRLSGVYQDATLTTIGNYYCQADGSLGTVATKVSMGTVTSTGKLCMPGGGGGGVQPATIDTLGGIIVGAGLGITTDGKLHTQKGFELFTTVGTATFTVPTGVTTVYVSGCGGGGGGGGGGTNYGRGASGGGGGACALKTALSVTAGNQHTITIGNGGSAGAINGNGSAGGTSSFGSLLSLAGGGYGSTVSSDGGPAGGSAGGTGGSAGGSSFCHSAGTSADYFGGGNGGGTIFGGGGSGRAGNAGNAGSGYGSGGSGGGGFGGDPNSGFAGAAGKAGFILVEW